jgi:hypothetical protein
MSALTPTTTDTRHRLRARLEEAIEDLDATRAIALDELSYGRDFSDELLSIEASLERVKGWLA